MKKSSKKLYQKYKNRIVDIFVFGSFIKGKFRPADIDLAVILKSTKQSELLTIRKKFDFYFSEKVHLNLILIENLLDNALFKTLLEEGYSLLNNNFLYIRLDYKSGAIFSFDLSKLKKSKKVLFSYALHGKKKESGILSNLNGKEIGKAVIFIPIDCMDEFKQFLELWNVEYYMMKVLA